MFRLSALVYGVLHFISLRSAVLFFQCGPLFQPSVQQTRRLSVHEYYSMGLLKEYGLNVPRGSMAQTPQEAADIARSLGLFIHFLNCSMSGVRQGGG